LTRQTTESFRDFVLDQLDGVRELYCKRMFSGYGLYTQGIFFGIIAAGCLYFKTNEKTRAKYIQEGMKPFQPSPKQTLKNYYQVPVDILENNSALAEWALEAAGL